MEAIKNFFIGKWAYRFQQLIILVLHLILLKWIMYVLSESGTLPMDQVFFHFLGLSIFGASLIRGSAHWAHVHWVRETKAENKS
jgi:sugar phosphate permease